jgi:hypothetical protein
MTLSKIGLRLAVPQIANQCVQFTKARPVSTVSASLPVARQGASLNARVGNMNIMAAQKVAHRCLSTNKPATSIYFQFPPVEDILEHFAQHPRTQDETFADRIVYRTIAGAFADQSKPLESIETSVMLALHRANKTQGYGWPESLLRRLTQDFKTALLEIHKKRSSSGL